MDTQKKVLILHASAGMGHAKAASGLRQAAKAVGAENVHVVDTLEWTSFGYGRRYKALYEFMIRYVPWLWGFCYASTDWPWVYFFVRPIRAWSNHFFAGKLETGLLDQAPELVIATHFMASEIVSRLKRRGKIHAKLVTVITDYQPHSFWLTAETDLYAVATEDTAQAMRRRGIPEDKLFVSGIPVEPKFSLPVHHKEELRHKMNLTANAFTVLVTSGGGGVGLVMPLVQKLMQMEPIPQMLVICGTNQKLLDRVKALTKDIPQARLFGFVDNVHELMAASDIVLGKGGGLTITESLCMEKPMVLIGAVPGQEVRNVECMVRAGAAKFARSPQQAIQHLLVFKRNSELYREAVKKIEALKRPRAAADIWAKAMELV